MLLIAWKMCLGLLLKIIFSNGITVCIEYHLTR